MSDNYYEFKSVYDGVEIVYKVLDTDIRVDQFLEHVAHFMRAISYQVTVDEIQYVKD